MGIDRYTPAIERHSSANCSVANVGPLAELGRYEIEVTALKRTLRGKVFLKKLLSLTGMEVSLTRLAAGESVPFLHRHRAHEELYIVTDGRGQMQVDGETFALAEGSVVRVAPDGARAIRAAADCTLGFVCIQAREGSMPDPEAKRDGLLLEGGVTWPG
jgi:quercetin dioxygenase-like cupin family protein